MTRVRLEEKRKNRKDAHAEWRTGGEISSFHLKIVKEDLEAVVEILGAMKETGLFFSAVLLRLNSACAMWDARKEKIG